MGSTPNTMLPYPRAVADWTTLSSTPSIRLKNVSNFCDVLTVVVAHLLLWKKFPTWLIRQANAFNSTHMIDVSTLPTSNYFLFTVLKTHFASTTLFVSKTIGYWPLSTLRSATHWWPMTWTRAHASHTVRRDIVWSRYAVKSSKYPVQ